jgi:Leucine-rich repeat (LRR) protein
MNVGTVTLSILRVSSNFVWQCLTGLSQLNLSYNCLEEFPMVVLGFPRLTELDLSHNSVRHLPWFACYVTVLTSRWAIVLLTRLQPFCTA